MDINSICQLQVIDKDGIYPTPGASKNEDGDLSVYAFDIAPPQIIDLAFKLCRDPQIVEFFVSLDCYGLPGQGTELDSLLCIFHIKRGEPARVGIMEYSWAEGKPAVKEICWQNEFWQNSYADLLKRLTPEAQGV